MKVPLVVAGILQLEKDLYWSSPSRPAPVNREALRWVLDFSRKQLSERSKRIVASRLKEFEKEVAPPFSGFKETPCPTEKK